MLREVFLKIINTEYNIYNNIKSKKSTNILDYLNNQQNIIYQLLNYD